MSHHYKIRLFVSFALGVKSFELKNINVIQFKVIQLGLVSLVQRSKKIVTMPFF